MLTMSCPSSPIFVPSHSSTPELQYPAAGNTPYPSASLTPFAGETPIPPLSHHSTPDSIASYIYDYKDATNNAMVEHLMQNLGIPMEEAITFMAMNQSVLEPFLCGVSPPPPSSIPHPPVPSCQPSSDLDIPTYAAEDPMPAPL